MKMDIEAARQLLLSEDSAERAEGVCAVAALASAGNPLALYATATWHLFGVNGYEKNAHKAEELLTRAADLGVAEAAFDLAVLNETSGRTDGRKKAFAYYCLSTILGDKAGAEEMARCIYYGIGTFKNRRVGELISFAANEGVTRKK